MGKFRIDITAEDVTFERPFHFPLSKDRIVDSGVYVMFDDDGVVLYVGKTKDFARRQKEHRQYSRFYRNVAKIDFYRTSTAYDREILETHLINELKPKHNKSKSFFRESEYHAELDEIEWELDELFADINDMTEELAKTVSAPHNMYTRETARIERAVIREELAEKKRKVDELRYRKSQLVQRLS